MNALVPTNTQLPAHLAKRAGLPSSLTDNLTSGIASGFKRVSVRGGRWRVREGKEEHVLTDPTLRCVIVGANPAITKTFFKGDYDKNSDKGPDCYSDDGVRPAADAEDPQSQLCANCPQNIFGSKKSESGANMKACSDQKRLAVMPVGSDLHDPEVYLLTVPPASLSNFRNYGNALKARGLQPEIVVTNISFDTKESFPKLMFDWGGWIEEDMLPTIDTLVGSQRVQEITGEKPMVAKVVDENYRPKASIAPAPKKEEVIDAEFEEAPQPKAKEPAPVPAVKASNIESDILNILNTMQDEDE